MFTIRCRICQPFERATGIPYHAYLAERLWRPMGARGRAHVTIDSVGTARASGGICATARDLARFGQLVLDGGRVADGRQLVPASWVADMRARVETQRSQHETRAARQREAR
jgi:CubicO group peptidase (beta-lactamase class C family)